MTPIGRGLLEETAKHLTHALSSAQPVIKARVKLLIETAIKDSPEYASLSHGRLRGELGLADPGMVQTVIDAIKESLLVQIHPAVVRGNNLEGGLTIGILRSDLSDVLSAPGASYVTAKGKVDWLEWLLTSGDVIVLAHYFYLPDRPDYSRTKEGIMGYAHAAVRGWRIPSEFSGTEGSNWLTRSLTGVLPNIVAAATEEITRAYGQ